MNAREKTGREKKNGVYVLFPMLYNNNNNTVYDVFLKKGANLTISTIFPMISSTLSQLCRYIKLMSIKLYHDAHMCSVRDDEPVFVLWEEHE